MSEQLTDEQMKDCRSTFALFDRDGDGVMVTRELGAAMRTMGYSPTYTEILDILNEVDTEGTGEIDFPTFLCLMAKKIKEYQGDDDLRLAFRVFDKDGKGQVTVPDFQYMLANLYRSNLTDHEVDQMTRDADPTHRGFITYNDFITLMAMK